jgi:CHAT domain-containing protein
MKGIAVGEEHQSKVFALRLQLGYVSSWAGDNKAALQSFELALQDLKGRNQSHLFNCYRWLVQVHIYLGDIVRAEEYSRELEAALEAYRKSPQFNEDVNFAWGREEVEFARGRLFDARGQFQDAEHSYELAHGLAREAVRNFPVATAGIVNVGNTETALDNLTASAGRAKARQGRFAEGEADARRALLGRLNSVGKYNLTTARTIPYLSTILIEQGRYSEAEKLTRAAIDVYRTLEVANESLAYATNLSELGTILALEEKWSEAAGVYAELDKVVEGWDKTRRADFLLTPARIYTLYNTGRLAFGLSEATSMVDRLAERVGETHFDYAVARGILAIGLLRADRDAEATREFRLAVPFLTRVAIENGDDDSNAAVREGYARRIIEAYISLLARAPAADGQAAWRETFQLAETIRAHSVQKALIASTLRVAANDPELASLIRREQDLEKQIGAEFGLLNNALAVPSNVRNGNVAAQLLDRLKKLRGEQESASKELKRRFPDYADLVGPKAPTVDGVKAILHTDESLVSFYLGHDQSFVWAIPKHGPLRFAVIPLSAAEIATKVAKLREALEPQAAMISDIPPFDLKLGYELYSLLLRPVEAGWKTAKNLFVVTNGALGLLPLSLLPTAPFVLRPDEDLLFSGYGKAPWLARTHAVTTIPSAAALLTLRNLPAGKPDRGELIAFGDPYFSKEQQREAEAIGVEARFADADSSVKRGKPLQRRNSPKLEGIDSAELAMLPRLPDTADELKSIALALRADASKVVYLGKQADEQTAKTIDLSRFKVVAFATHGLVPGELNGLTQPALALSSPDVTGAGGDGLLTLDEILGLKLDADWVVLSACNTGAGAGAGAEAASGLGRAFFYAGTRALLVTNWSVNSLSARELVTDLFKRQADDPKLGRGEALRQAMMALVDGPGYIGADGKTEFAYAHPLFWAPYSIIGDGGAR